MTDEDSGPRSESCSKQPEPTTNDTLSSQRVFKKSSPNNKLTLYLSSRDLVVSSGKIDSLQGVLLVDPDFVEDRKVYGQITLTFRYGREDEEVMGLKFCNEAVMCLAQLYPVNINNPIEEITPLQEALLKRLGPNAYPFNMEITPLAPPSVQLVPAKEYNGAPIGTSYDIRAYVAEKTDEKLQRRTTVRMGIRVVQKTFPPPSPSGYEPGATNDNSVGGGGTSTKERGGRHRVAQFGWKCAAPHDSIGLFGPPSPPPPPPQSTLSTSGDGGSPSPEGNTSETAHDDAAAGILFKDLPPPHATIEKPFLLSDGRIELDASLNQAIYHHGEEVQVTVNVHNNSNKTIRRLKVFIVQHVDVCMFSNGKFKNVVAMISSKDDCPVMTGGRLARTFHLVPVRSATKNWIALEDSYTKAGTSLASTVTSYGNHPDERNVFAIYVSYYVKVKLILSVMGGDVSLKLPFSLMHTCNEFDPHGTLTRVFDHARMVSPPMMTTPVSPSVGEVDVKPAKDGT